MNIYIHVEGDAVIDIRHVCVGNYSMENEL